MQEPSSIKVIATMYQKLISKYNACINERADMKNLPKISEPSEKLITDSSTLKKILSNLQLSPPTLTQPMQFAIDFLISNFLKNTQNTYTVNKTIIIISILQAILEKIDNIYENMSILRGWIILNLGILYAKIGEKHAAQVYLSYRLYYYVSQNKLKIQNNEFGKNKQNMMITDAERQEYQQTDFCLQLEDDQNISQSFFQKLYPSIKLPSTSLLPSSNYELILQILYQQQLFQTAYLLNHQATKIPKIAPIEPQSIQTQIQQIKYRLLIFSLLLLDIDDHIWHKQVKQIIQQTINIDILPHQQIKDHVISYKISLPVSYIETIRDIINMIYTDPSQQEINKIKINLKQIRKILIINQDRQQNSTIKINNKIYEIEYGQINQYNKAKIYLERIQDGSIYRNGFYFEEFWTNLTQDITLMQTDLQIVENQLYGDDITLLFADNNSLQTHQKASLSKMFHEFNVIFKKCQESIKYIDLNYQRTNIYLVYHKSGNDQNLITQSILNKVRATFIHTINVIEPINERTYVFKKKDELIRQLPILFRKQFKMNMPFGGTPNFSFLCDDIAKMHRSQRNISWMLAPCRKKQSYKHFQELSDYLRQRQRIEISFNSNIFDKQAPSTQLKKELKIIQIYTSPIFFYQILNRGLRSLTHPLNIPYIRYPFAQLCRAIISLHIQQRDDNMFSQEFQCYRGCFLTSSQIQKFKNSVGNFIQSEGFMSTSRNPQKAQIFSKKHTLIITIPIINNVQFPTQGCFADIKKYSFYQGEQQILFNPLCYFQVEKMIEKQKDSIQIYMRYITVDQLSKMGPNQKLLVNCHRKFQEERQEMFSQAGLFKVLNSSQHLKDYHIRKLTQAVLYMQEQIVRKDIIQLAEIIVSQIKYQDFLEIILGYLKKIQMTVAVKKKRAMIYILIQQTQFYYAGCTHSFLSALSADNVNLSAFKQKILSQKIKFITTKEERHNFYKINSYYQRKYERDIQDQEEYNGETGEEFIQIGFFSPLNSEGQNQEGQQYKIEDDWDILKTIFATIVQMSMKNRHKELDDAFKQKQVYLHQKVEENAKIDYVYKIYIVFAYNYLNSGNQHQARRIHLKANKINNQKKYLSINAIQNVDYKIIVKIRYCEILISYFSKQQMYGQIISYFKDCQWVPEQIRLHVNYWMARSYEYYDRQKAIQSYDAIINQGKANIQDQAIKQYVKYSIKSKERLLQEIENFLLE